MLVGVIADSHDHLFYLEKALERFHKEAVEGVLHLGDIVAPFAAKRLVENWTGPLKVIYGNNDGERRGLKQVLPDIIDGPLLVEWGGRRISIDHYPPDEEHRPIPDCDVVLFGHTHLVLQTTEHGPLWLNPGESCGWVTGTATIALLDTESLNVEMISLAKS